MRSQPNLAPHPPRFGALRTNPLKRTPFQHNQIGFSDHLSHNYS